MNLEIKTGKQNIFTSFNQMMIKDKQQAENNFIHKYGAKSTNKKEVHIHLQNLIYRGVFQPGDRLPPERDLAKQLGVSRPTLREGINVLAAAEMLRDLPKNHPKRERIMLGFKTMMASLLKYQAKSGLWRQLIDVPESWEETSGTGMFTYAMVTGVKEGWLDAKTYGPAARKAWLALVGKLDENANVNDVCVGTDKGFSVKYYLDRERKTGDLHGQSPILWTASALMR